MRTTVFAMLMAFVLAIGAGGYSADVHAKKFGGGKSFGKSFSISKPKATSAATSGAATSAATSGAATSTKRPGLLGGLGGGLLGGLLVGGLFATLLGSGAFEGISFGDILLFALIGFLVYKFFIAPKRRAAEQAAGNGMFRQMGGNTQPSPMGGLSGFGGQSEIQLPPGFNEQNFVTEAKDHYITLQKAWDDNNFDEILDYVTPELYNLLVTERASYGDNKPRTEVVSLMAEIVRGELTASTASISLQFSGWIKEGDETSDTNEIWHLEKSLASANANWTIVGIQQDN